MPKIKFNTKINLPCIKNDGAVFNFNRLMATNLLYWETGKVQPHYKISWLD